MLYTVLKFTLKEDSEYDYSISLEVKGREIDVEFFQERCHTTKKIRMPLRDDLCRILKTIRTFLCLQKASTVTVETFESKETEQKKDYLTMEMWDLEDIIEEMWGTYKREKRFNEAIDIDEPDVPTQYFDAEVLLMAKIRDILGPVLDHWVYEANQQEKEMRFLSLIEKDPKCPVLLDDLTPQTAVVLPCQHLISKKALERMFVSGEANCPLCRQKAYRSQIETL